MCYPIHMKLGSESEPMARNRVSFLGEGVAAEGTLDADEEIFPDAEVLVETEPGLYLRGLVLAVGDADIEVAFGEDEREQCARSHVWPANEAGLYVEDTSALVHLSEATIVENIRAGLVERESIYQWVGPTLIAVNPMRTLSGGERYGAAAMERCRNGAAANPPAHPFFLVELALRDLVRQGRSAAFVVSGESGAGKTECNKHLLQYCLWRAGHEGVLASRLRAVTPLVELFGSGATRHNANSSRVGRFLQLHLGVGARPSDRGVWPTPVVRHAQLQTFLLERSRVVSVNVGERGFHSFYGLLGTAPLAGAIGLLAFGHEPSEFGYLHPGVAALPGRDDAAEFASGWGALGALGVSAADATSAAQLLAAVLLLGNVSFEQSAEGASPTEGSHAALAQLGRWLGADLSGALLHRSMPGGFGRANVLLPRDAAAAARARDAVARALYVRLFAHLVELVNAALASPDAPTEAPTEAEAAAGGGGIFGGGGGGGGCGGGGGGGRLGLLDIFGFERFEINSFEQLLINYSNEALHAHFLRSIFESELRLYKAEGVPWPDVPVGAEELDLSLPMMASDALC